MEARPLADLLRELREQQGTSLRSAARDLKVDPSYLSRLERGEKPASGQLLQRAANYYDVSVEELQLAAGSLPPDVVEILARRPELVDELRKKYGSS